MLRLTLGLCHLYIHRPGSFRTSLRIELYAVALFQSVKIGSLQSGAVKENLPSIFCTDEPESPFPDNSLYRSFQTDHLSLIIFNYCFPYQLLRLSFPWTRRPPGEKQTPGAS